MPKSSLPSAGVQQNADRTTHQLVANYGYPWLLGAIGIGFLVIAFEILKAIIGKIFCKLFPKKPRQRRR